VNFTAAMRTGSLEILGALAVFGFLALRLQPARSEARPKAVSVSLRVRETPSLRSASRELAVTVSEGTPCSMGRSGQVDVALADPEVSRRHARFELVRGVLYLTDEGSSNGTFLNGKPLRDESIELRPGDDIDVGNTRITISGMEPVR
jgi:S-DNA-T family DNA segregation ATPase FtsK/SpoIIIE